MIKTAIKHWIFEVCIEQVFNGIENNFSTLPKKEKVPDYMWQAARKLKWHIRANKFSEGVIAYNQFVSVGESYDIVPHSFYDVNYFYNKVMVALLKAELRYQKNKHG